MGCRCWSKPGRVEKLLRPDRDAGALWLRGLEGEGLSAATVRVRLAAKAFYKALRWAGASKVVPFTDVRASKELTRAHAGLRVSEVCRL